jgi:hypothetical protein
MTHFIKFLLLVSYHITIAELTLKCESFVPVFQYFHILSLYQDHDKKNVPDEDIVHSKYYYASCCHVFCDHLSSKLS